MEPTPETTSQLLERLNRLSESNHADSDISKEVRPPDLAEALSSLPPESAAKIIQGMSFASAVAVFDEHSFTTRGEVLALLELDLATALVEAMSPDERADLFRQLSSDLVEVLRPRLSKEAAHNLSALLRYHPESAGGIMTTEFVSMRPNLTVGQALDYIRAVASEMETIYYVYIVDGATGVLMGVVSLREILVNPPSRPMQEVMFTEPKMVRVDTDQEEAAKILSRYDLLAVPVVNAKQQLVGIVTVDDVLDVMIEEQAEDLQKIGGMQAIETPYLETSFFDLFKKRGVWLAVLLVGEMFTATAMSYFEDELAAAIVLSLFLPLIISSGGNSGSQATTLIIRALSLGEMGLSDWWRVVRREFFAGLALGSLLAVLGFARVFFWHLLGMQDYGPYYPLIALTVGFSLVGVVLFGTMVGSMLPFLLKRAGLDPASASAPLVATFVDVTGLVIYFMVARAILLGSML